MYSHPALIRQHIAICSAAAKRCGDNVAALTLQLSKNGQIQIFPDGYFKAIDGRPYDLPQGWLLNESVASRLLAKLAQRKNRMVIDYEHQTLNAQENGKEAPAAGWINPADIEYRPEEGLFTQCTWTDKAKGFIEAGEYLYLSPVFEYHPETGEVLDLINVAITNDPALDGMKAIEALRKNPSHQPQEDTPVKREELIAMLGLAKDATDEQIRAALKARLADSDSYAALCKELELKEGDDPKAKVTALKSASNTAPDPAKFVPIEMVEDLKSDIAELKAANTQTEVTALVDQALDDGKLLEAQKDWAIELGNSDVAALKTYIEKTPAIAALKGTQTKGKQPEGTNDTGLDETERAVCKQMGISPEDYKKANAQED